MVEQLGDAAGAPLSVQGFPPQPQPLAIIDLPAYVDWAIEEHGGAEWVVERHRRWDAEGELSRDQGVRLRGTG